MKRCYISQKTPMGGSVVIAVDNPPADRSLYSCYCDLDLPNDLDPIGWDIYLLRLISNAYTKGKNEAQTKTKQPPLRPKTLEQLYELVDMDSIVIKTTVGELTDLQIKQILSVVLNHINNRDAQNIVLDTALQRVRSNQEKNKQ